MSTSPTANQAFMLLKQEEKQRQIHSSAITSHVALMVNMPKPSASVSYYIPNCFSDRKAHHVLKCSRCHIKGHTKDRCYKLVGYPLGHPYHPNNKGKKKPANSRFTKPSQAHPTVTSPPVSNNLSTGMEELQTQFTTLIQWINKSGPANSSGPFNSSISGGTSASTPTQYSIATHIACTIYSFSSHISEDAWVIDTGVTNHMYCDIKCMHDVNTLSTPLTVNLSNGESANVTHIGSVYFHPLSLSLPNVLYIPSFTFNLLSVRKLST